MRPHHGPIAFLASLALAAMLYVLVIVPGRQEEDHLRGGILETGLVELERRLAHAPDAEVAALLELDVRLSEVFSEPVDRWQRFSGDSSRPPAARFRERFQTWLNRMRSEEILEPGAWPAAPWRIGASLPTVAEMDRTVRLGLLVEGLAKEIRARGGTGLVNGVDPGRASGEVEITLAFDPDRGGALVDALTRPTLGGEPFDLISVGTHIPASGPGIARLRIRTAGWE